MNVEFKVGDKVRFKAASNEYYTQGRVYEVTSSCEGGIMCGLTDDYSSSDASNGEHKWESLVIAEYFERIDEPQADQSEPQPKATKVKLTQDEMKVVKEARFIYGTQLDAIIRDRMADALPNEISLLDTIPLDTLIRALYVGYEVEQTPEEKALVAYEAAERMLNAESRKDEKSYESGFWWGKINGMKSVLDAYGIKVKGINGND